jgi:competence protein ComEC
MAGVNKIFYLNDDYSPRWDMKKVWAVLLVLVLCASTITAWLYLYHPSDGDATDGPEHAQVDLDLLSVHFIDVGQGDATLIMAPSGARVLIDAGALDSEDVLLEYLAHYNVTKLDALIISHPDSDHLGSADAVLRKIDVDLVIHPGFFKDTPAYDEFLSAVEEEGCPVLTSASMVEGQYLDLADDLTVQVLSAYLEADDSNSASIVLRVSYGSEDLMFMGDAPSGVEDWVMRHYDIDSEVLKVAHHGSYSSTSQDFLDEVTPQYAVIFCAQGNDYGYPHDEVLDRLASVGAAVYRTDLSGTIVLESDGSSLTMLS